MSSIVPRTAVATLQMLSAACSPTTQRAPRPAYDRNYLARAELATRSTDNMFSLVRSLRPNWLATPMGGAGISTPGSAPVTVYLDGREFGPAEMLKSISSEAVEYARYYSTTEAQSKYGLRVVSPVIDITTRKPGS